MTCFLEGLWGGVRGAEYVCIPLRWQPEIPRPRSRQGLGLQFVSGVEAREWESMRSGVESGVV